MENDYQKSVTIQQELSIEAKFDGVFLVRDFTYTVTEIPVYIGKKLSGHILIVQPQNKYTNELFITMASNLYYNAYVLGNVRTHPTGAPSNMFLFLFLFNQNEFNLCDYSNQLSQKQLIYIYS